MSVSPIAPTAPRDHRIDMIRGLALAMIFINHVPGTFFEHLTSRNFGFSDAAEAFVLLAGISAALAYGRGFALGQAPRALWQAVARPWKRAWTLYLLHLMLSLAVLAVVAAVMRFGGSPGMILRDNFRAILEDPLGTYIGLPLLVHQFGYVNILPLYVVLLLAAPLILWTGRRFPLWLLAGSVALWLAAGISRINFPSYPTPYGWFLNPLSWQLLFVIGTLIGLRLKEGARFLPTHPRLIAAAAAYAVVALLWARLPALGELGRGVLSELTALGVPRVLTQFDKGYLELPRLLHVLSLAYLASVLPGLAQFAASGKARALTVMGRQALPIFALGTVLAFVVRAIRWLLEDAGRPSSPALDSLLICGGVALLISFAALREALAPPRPGTGGPAPIPPAPAPTRAKALPQT